MTLLHRARLAAQRVGLDFTRYPKAGADYEAFRAFISSAPDVILDVGANDGGFAQQCRRFGFTGEIVSFEPGSEAFARLAAQAERDARWSVHRMGLGDRVGELILHVAANAGASSSLLPMLPTHEQAAPDAKYVAAETVPVNRLDAWVAHQSRTWQRIALKIDTQGYERQVLEGVGDLLREAVVSVQLELSLVPLYEGAWLWDEATDWLGRHSLTLAGLTPGFSDPATGRLLQFDGVFLKDSE
jgi:FkbM family methyltransferase